MVATEMTLIRLLFVLIIFVPLGIIVFFNFFQKQAEDKRVNLILSRQNEWGEEMCKWLIENKVNPMEVRVAEILSYCGDFTAETCQNLIREEKIG